MADEENYIIIAIVAVIAIVLVSLFVIVANLQKTVLIRVKEKAEQEEAVRHITIEQLVELAAKRSTSRNDLTAAILRASKECPFPKKDKGIAPNVLKSISILSC